MMLIPVSDLVMPDVLFQQGRTLEIPRKQFTWDPALDGIGDSEDSFTFQAAVPMKNVGKPIKIVGKFFTVSEFANYVKSEVQGAINSRGHWKPRLIVLHNTAKPTLAQRPSGFSGTDMNALAGYYGRMGWHAGPSLFVDDNGIWVFSALTSSGVHSPSWNSISWGIEQLGDFAKETYDVPRASKVRDNALAATAILCVAAGLNTSDLRLHKEDPKTTHNCPGKTCTKSEVVSTVQAQINVWRTWWSKR